MTTNHNLDPTTVAVLVMSGILHQEGIDNRSREGF